MYQLKAQNGEKYYGKISYKVKNMVCPVESHKLKNEQITTKPTEGANISAKGGGKTKVPTGLETAANATGKFTVTIYALKL